MGEAVDTRISAKQPANRCPYCHDDVSRDEAVACRDCLARHHSACWGEATGCSACSCSVRLEVAGQARPALSPKVAGELLAEHGYSKQEVRELLTRPDPVPVLLRPLVFALPVFVFGMVAVALTGLFGLLGGGIFPGVFAAAFVVGAGFGLAYAAIAAFLKH